MSKINNVFIVALKEVLNEESNNIFVEEHIFSKKFESKMKTLINRRKKPYYRMINSTGKRVACFALILLILLSATALAFDNVRFAIADFFVRVFDTHSIIESQEDYIFPDSIDEMYEITYNLDGYIEEVWSDTPTSRCIDYVKDTVCISFCQYTKSSFNIDMNTEESVIEKTQINSYEGIYYMDNHNYHHIMWDNGDYIFYISSNIDKDTLVKIAESVKK